MLDSIFFYTYVIHLLIDTTFLVHEMLTEPFNFYVERDNNSSVYFPICSKRKIKWADFPWLYSPPPPLNLYNVFGSLKIFHSLRSNISSLTE